MRRNWTTREEIEACTLRWLGCTNAEIAARLNHPVASVHCKLRRLMPRAIRVHKPGELARKVRKMHAKGLDDKAIAVRLNLSHKTINATRYRMGLASTVPPLERSRRGGLAKAGKYEQPDRGAGLVRCIGCDRTCPTGSLFQASGWLCRPMPGYEEDNEYHCPRCFKEFGFGEPARATA